MLTRAGGLGLTALLHPKKDPFRSWAKHLASFGAQAGIVAESPYYKMLIGKILGYKDDNIVFHIRVSAVASTLATQPRWCVNGMVHYGIMVALWAVLALLDGSVEHL